MPLSLPLCLEGWFVSLLVILFLHLARVTSIRTINKITNAAITPTNIPRTGEGSVDSELSEMEQLQVKPLIETEFRTCKTTTTKA